MKKRNGLKKIMATLILSTMLINTTSLATILENLDSIGEDSESAYAESPNVETQEREEVKNESIEEIEAEDSSMVEEELPSSYIIEGLAVEDEKYQGEIEAEESYRIDKNSLTVEKQINGWCWAYSSIKVLETTLMKKTGKPNTSFDFSEAHLAYSRAPYFGGDWNSADTDWENLKHGGDFSQFLKYLGVVPKEYSNYNEKWNIQGPVDLKIIANADYNKTIDTQKLFMSANKSWKVTKAVSYAPVFKQYNDKGQINTSYSNNKNNSENYHEYYNNGYKFSKDKVEIEAKEKKKEAIELYREKIKQHLYNKGGLYAAVLCKGEFYTTEGKGTDKYYNGTNKALYVPENITENIVTHAVTIVGYDDDYSRKNFSTEPSHDGAYIAINSWGDKWGDGGYVYISYDDAYVERDIWGILEVEEYSNQPSIDVSYSTQAKTNGNVTVTIKSKNKLNKPDNSWSITSNKKISNGNVYSWDGKDVLYQAFGEIYQTETQLTKIYDTNTNETLTITDMSGAKTKVPIKINNIDKTGPTLTKDKITITGTKYNGYYAPGVKLEITGEVTDESGLHKKPYKFGNNDWVSSSYQNSVTYVEPGEKVIRARDTLENETKLTYYFNNIDNKGPEFDYEISYQNGVSTVTIVNATDEHSGLNDNGAYSKDKKNWQKSNSFQFNKDGTYYIYVRDNVGNITSKTVTIISSLKYDSITLSPKGVWTKSVKVTVNGLKDDVKKLPSDPYSYDNGKTWTNKNYNSYGTNGKKTILMRNSAGEQINASINIGNIDSAAPIVTNKNHNGTTVTAVVEDTQSKVAKYRWTIGEDENKPIKDLGWKTINPVKNTITLTLDLTKYQAQDKPVYLYTVDGYGNESKRKIEKITYAIESNGKDEKTNIISYKITVNTAISIDTEKMNEIIKETANEKFKLKKLYLNNSKKVLLAEIECPKDTTSKGKVTLKKGVLKIGTVNYDEDIIINLDNTTKPTIKIGNIDSTPTNKNVPVKITLEDSDSGIAKYEITKDGTIFNNISATVQHKISQAFTLNLANGEYKVKVWDVDGNYSEESFKISNVYTEAPTITEVTKSITALTNKNVKLTVNASSKGAEISGYSFDGGKTWQKSNNKEYSKYTTGIIVKVKDEAGNTSTYKDTIDITNINKSQLKLDVKYMNGSYIKGSEIVFVQSNKKLQLTDSLKNQGWGLTQNGTLYKVYNQNTLDDGEKLEVTDVYGNKSTVTVKVDYIDNTAPTIRRVDLSKVGNKYKLTIGAIDIANSGDASSGVSKYSFDGGKTWQNEWTKEYDRPTNNITIKVKDVAGNIATKIVNMTGMNIQYANTSESTDGTEVDQDLTENKTLNPQVIYNDELTNKPVEVKINVEKSVKIPKEAIGWEISEDGKTLKKIYTEKSYEVLTLIDSENEEYSVDIEVSIMNIDKESPNAELYYSALDIENNTVEIMAVVDKEIREVEGWNLSEDKTILKKEVSKEIIEQGINLVIKDLAGNEATINIKKEITEDDDEYIKSQPQIIYTTSEGTEIVTVKVPTAVKLADDMEGWNLSEDGKTITKTYTQNQTDALIIINVEDEDDVKELGINIEGIEITGDINEDRKVNITDLLMLKRHLIAGDNEDWKLTDQKLKQADVNKDGQVNISDLILLKRLLE